MVQAQNLDKELYAAIALLNDVQKRAILTIANAFTSEDPSERYQWEVDQAIVAEMESRWSDYKNGGKMHSAEEVNAEVKSLLQTFKDK